MKSIEENSSNGYILEDDLEYSAWYPNLTKQTKKEASSYAKQMDSFFSSIGQNAYNISQRI